MFRLIGGFFRMTFKMALLAAGIGAIIAYANLSDVEGWKQDLQDRVGKLSGRSLHIDGPIDFTVSLPPRIIVRGVRIENAKWGSQPDMLTAQALIAEVDFLPLLLGDVAVPRMQLVGVDILVETNANGANNWDDLNNFQTSAGGPPSTPGFPVIGPILGSGGIGLSGGSITIANLATGAINTLTLPGAIIDVGGIVSGIVDLPCL